MCRSTRAADLCGSNRSTCELATRFLADGDPPGTSANPAASWRDSPGVAARRAGFGRPNRDPPIYRSRCRHGARYVIARIPTLNTTRADRLPATPPRTARAERAGGRVMYSAILFVLLVIVPLLLLFVAVEFHHCQRGHSTWGWVRRLYDALGAEKVRW